MIRKIAPHLVIVITIIMAVLLVINSINDAMGFLRGSVFTTLLIIYCVVSLISAVFLIISNSKKRKKYVYKKKMQEIEFSQNEDNN